MNISSSYCFMAFDREINNSRNWLQAKVFETCGYSREVLLDRLLQRLIELSLYPYASAVKAHCKITDNCLPPPETKINCRRAFMETGSGRVTLTFRQWVANQFDFILHWAFCLFAILSVWKTSRVNLPAVLFLGVGDEVIFADKNDEQFVRYCRHGPIEPLRNGQRFLVESSSKHISSNHPTFVYRRRPLISLLREARIGFFGRFQLLANHLMLFFAYLSAAIRLPQLSLLGRDFAYSSTSFELDRRGLIESIVLTCSSFNCQPLWVRALRRARVHMIWYAQNWKPIAYATDNLKSDHPNLRWIRVDTQWVWTHAFARYLRNLGPGSAIEVVGPIAWYMPEIESRSKDSIEIVIFDVPPFHDDTALRNGEITNYCHPNNLRAFIRDVIALKLEIEKAFKLPVTFSLKMKRGYATDYDRAYFDYIAGLASLGAISLKRYSMNIYSLVSGSHLVIAYPFTSPAYIAEFLDVPAIYYDPTKAIIRQDFCDAKARVSFVSGPQHLRDISVSLLNKVLSERVPA